MTKKQELAKKVFESNLDKHLKFLGYENYQLELEEGIYNLSFKNEPLSIYFDDFKFLEPYFLNFYIKGSKSLVLWKKDINAEEQLNQSNKHIKADFNKKQLQENKEKIRQLILVDKITQITQIAEKLGMTRQAIYKNIELKKFIEGLRN